MNFSFSTKPLPVEADASKSLETLFEANDYFESLETLQQSMIDLNQVCEVMENIQQSIDLLNKYGDKAIEQLNIDKGLEAITGMQQHLITLPTALQSLESADEGLWEKFKRYIGNIWDAICNLIKAIFGMTDNEKKEADALEAAATIVDDAKLAAAPVPENISTPEQVQDDEKDAEEASAIIIEINVCNNEIKEAVQAAANTADAAQIQKLVEKIAQTDKKLDGLSERLANNTKPEQAAEPAPTVKVGRSAAPKKKASEKGWGSKTKVSWFCGIIRKVSDKVSQLYGAVTSSAKSAKEAIDKLEALKKSGKKEVEEVVRRGRAASNKAAGVAGRATSKLNKCRKRRRATMAGLHNALAASDNYSSDDNPEY